LSKDSAKVFSDGAGLKKKVNQGEGIGTLGVKGGPTKTRGRGALTMKANAKFLTYEKISIKNGKIRETSLCLKGSRQSDRAQRFSDVCKPGV